MSAPTADTSQDTGALSESQAIERLTGLQRDGKIPEPKDPEALLEEDEESAEPAADADNAAPEGAEFAEAEDEDAEAKPAASADPVVKFDDGTEMPLSEVKRGFLRQQDYTRKTQETATLRKQVESERQQYLAEKQMVADRLTPLIMAVKAQLENPAEVQALQELRQTDPGAYAARLIDLQHRQQQLAQLEGHQAALREQAQREQAETFQRERMQAAEQSRAALMESIPAAKKDFAGWYRSLGEYVTQQGVPQEFWDNEVDHRVITLAWKAKQYDDATRKAPAVKETLRKSPQPMRPGAAKPPGHAQARAIREADARLSKSGSMEDAIALMRARGVR